MPWLRLKLELVTPCFLAGADGSESSVEGLEEEGLRPASLIGSWRYWLRAYLGATGNDPRQREGVLFGTQNKGARQGAVQVRVRPHQQKPTLISKNRDLPTLTGKSGYDWFQDGKHQSIDPLQYLLGQGLAVWNKEQKKALLSRSAFAAGQLFDIDINLRAMRNDQSAWQALRATLWLWNLFGGIGARSRRGWGSVQIASVEQISAIPIPAEQQRWQEWFGSMMQWSDEGCRRVLGRLSDLAKGQLDADSIAPQGDCLALGPGTDPLGAHAIGAGHDSAFSHLGACCAILPDATYPIWAEALAYLGRTMLTIRSNAPGRDRPTGLDRVKDHDEVHDLLHRRGAKLNEAPCRAAFGLPHNYFFRDGAKTSFEGAVKNESRRASPVLLHIAKVTVGPSKQPCYAPVVFWFKSRITSDGKITCKEQSGLPTPNWSSVVSFLQELLNPFGTTPAHPSTATATTAEPTIAAPPPSKIKPKPIGAGQSRSGQLKKKETGWVAWFEDLQREGRISGGKQLLATASDGAKAEFYIEVAKGDLIVARLEKILP